MRGVWIIRIKKLYAGLGVLIFLCSGIGVYLLAVQYTQLLRLEEDILLTSETTEVPETLDFTTQVIFHALSILGQIGVLVGLVLLTIRTKSKGYLFFMGKGIGKLGIIVMLVYLKQNVGTLQSYAFVKKIDYTLDILLTALYILGIYILYKEYKGKGVRDTQQGEHCV